MKVKIKNIKQLRKEKRLLQQREKELLRLIHSDWHQLKVTFHPQNIFRGQMRHYKEENFRNGKEDSIFNSTLAFVLSLLAKKLSRGATEKLAKFFN